VCVCATLSAGVKQAIVLLNQGVMFSVATPLCQAAVYMLEEANKPYEGHATYVLALHPRCVVLRYPVHVVAFVLQLLCVVEGHLPVQAR